MALLPHKEKKAGWTENNQSQELRITEKSCANQNDEKKQVPSTCTGFEDLTLRRSNLALEGVALKAVKA